MIEPEGPQDYFTSEETEIGALQTVAMVDVGVNV